MKPRVWRACAHRLIANGYSPMPIFPGRRPPKEWDKLRDAPLSVDAIDKYARLNRDLGLAVAGGYGGLVPIDIDATDPEIIAAIKAALPEPVVARVGEKGWLAFYRYTPDDPVNGRDFVSVAQRPVVEIKTRGNAMIPPSRHHETGRPYTWSTARTLWDTPIGEHPIIGSADIERLAAALAPWLPPPRQYAPVQVPPETRTSDRRRLAYARATLQGQVKLLSAMGKDAGRNPALFRAVCILGRCVHHQILSEAELRDALLQACQANGSVRDHGLRQCHATITQGLKRSANDPLGSLPDRCAA